MGLFSSLLSNRKGKKADAPAGELFLPVSVREAGGIAAWNRRFPRAHLLKTLDAMVTATTPDEAMAEVTSIMDLGHNLWAYAYMRMLFEKTPELYYATLLAAVRRRTGPSSPAPAAPHQLSGECGWPI
jgi:hypothetical protein